VVHLGRSTFHAISSWGGLVNWDSGKHLDKEVGVDRGRVERQLALVPAACVVPVSKVLWFQGGLVFEAHRHLYHSASGSRTF